MKGLSDVDFQNLTVFPACIPRSELGIQNIFSRIIVVETRFLKRRRAFRFVVLRRKMCLLSVLFLILLPTEMFLFLRQSIII